MNARFFVDVDVENCSGGPFMYETVYEIWNNQLHSQFIDCQIQESDFVILF